jgi:hypothetical protein
VRFFSGDVFVSFSSINAGTSYLSALLWTVGEQGRVLQGQGVSRKAQLSSCEGIQCQKITFSWSRTVIVNSASRHFLRRVLGSCRQIKDEDLFPLIYDMIYICQLQLG